MFYEIKFYSDACTYAFIYMNKEIMIPVIVLVFPMFNGSIGVPPKIILKKNGNKIPRPDKPEIRITGVRINEAVLQRE